MDEPSTDDFRRVLRKVKEYARKGYKQGNYYKFEDILREIEQFANEQNPLDF